jgi:hypothetical protein
VSLAYFSAIAVYYRLTIRRLSRDRSLASQAGKHPQSILAAHFSLCVATLCAKFDIKGGGFDISRGLSLY